MSQLCLLFVLLELWNHKRHVTAGIKTIQILRYLMLLKEPLQFQGKIAAVEETQIPNKPSLTENMS